MTIELVSERMNAPWRADKDSVACLFHILRHRLRVPDSHDLRSTNL